MQMSRLTSLHRYTCPRCSALRHRQHQHIHLSCCIQLARDQTVEQTQSVTDLLYLTVC